MKKHVLAAILAAALLFSLSGCGGSAPAKQEDGTLRILATTYPVYLFTTAVTDGVEGVEVTRLITGEVSCLHDYTLSVNDMKAIEAADVIVMNGAGLEDFMADALATSKAAVIDCSEGIELLPTRGHEGHDHGEEEGDHYDPHFWMNPYYAVQMMGNISMALESLTHGDSQTEHGEYHTAFLAAKDKVNYAVQRWEEALSTLTNRNLITFHDGFQYFTRSSGLTLLKAIEEEEGAEASAAEIKEIVALIKEYDIPAIFTEVNGSDSTARAIARETGVAVYPLNLIMSGDGTGIQPYIDAMNTNINTILEALQ